MDTSYIPNLPSGPLCEYRKRAKFDWKKLRIFFEGENSLKIKYMIWNELETDPLFRPSPVTLPVDEQKRLAALQVKRVIEYKFLPEDIKNSGYKPRLEFLMNQNEALHSISPNLSVKMALGIGLFSNALTAMGTERHKKYFEAAWNREIIACLAITELSHGSNTKRIRTTAKYDKDTKEFVIHTPDFEAAKVWVGNLGKTASIALTFALLITPDGHNHGLHGFLIPVRDPQTLDPYPGVVVGDIGEKIGLNGIDNGFVMFNNYRIPKDCLLNRTGDVTDEGIYESVFSEPGKILGAALESLSAGRLGIMQESANTISNAVVIAVRYAAIRKQFGTEQDGPESPIMEYQLHQWRIFPYLAAACAFKVAVKSLADTYLSTVEKSQADSNGFELLTQTVSEIHALVSSSKALFTWTTRDAIQETRESCGGHGYLKAANIGELRNCHDPSVTYEGDNNVLAQQCSNWLLRQWKGKLESPLGTANFLKQKENILNKHNFNHLKSHNKVDLLSFDFILSCYEWLLCYLMDTTSKQIEAARIQGTHFFKAKNDSQVYKARNLSLAFAEYFILMCFKKRFYDPDVADELKPALQKIFFIYGLWCIDKHLVTFYIGQFASGPEFGDFVRSNLLEKCAEIKDFAVTVADSLAPPDWVLNSVLGKSDGRIYENLQNAFMSNPGAMEKPSWWADVVTIKSKL